MYEIADYDKRYQPRDKSRHPLVHADYVKLPVKPRGDGLQTLLKHKRGLEVFGIWCLLLEKTTLEKPENRGKLLNHRERPANIEEIAMGICLENKTKLIEYALSLLVSMGWLTYAGSAGNCGETAPLSVVKCSVVKSNKEKAATQFDLFWKTYPKRNGKKIGKRDCWEWWVKNQPSEKDIVRIVGWLRTDVAKRERAAAAGAFYAAPKDPARWLRKQGWIDDVGGVGDMEVNKYAGKKCLNQPCKGPVVYEAKDDTGQIYYKCLEHAPAKIRELYC